MGIFKKKAGSDAKQSGSEIISSRTSDQPPAAGTKVTTTTVTTTTTYTITGDGSASESSRAYQAFKDPPSNTVTIQQPNQPVAQAFSTGLQLPAGGATPLAVLEAAGSKSRMADLAETLSRDTKEYLTAPAHNSSTLGDQSRLEALGVDFHKKEDRAQNHENNGRRVGQSNTNLGSTSLKTDNGAKDGAQHQAFDSTRSEHSVKSNDRNVFKKGSLGNFDEDDDSPEHSNSSKVTNDYTRNKASKGSDSSGSTNSKSLNSKSLRPKNSRGVTPLSHPPSSTGPNRPRTPVSSGYQQDLDHTNDRSNNGVQTRKQSVAGPGKPRKLRAEKSPPMDSSNVGNDWDGHHSQSSLRHSDLSNDTSDDYISDIDADTTDFNEDAREYEWQSRPKQKVVSKVDKVKTSAVYDPIESKDVETRRTKSHRDDIKNSSSWLDNEPDHSSSHGGSQKPAKQLGRQKSLSKSNLNSTHGESARAVRFQSPELHQIDVRTDNPTAQSVGRKSSSNDYKSKDASMSPPPQRQFSPSLPSQTFPGKDHFIQQTESDYTSPPRKSNSPQASEAVKNSQRTHNTESNQQIRSDNAPSMHSPEYSREPNTEPHNGQNNSFDTTKRRGDYVSPNVETNSKPQPRQSKGNDTYASPENDSKRIPGAQSNIHVGYGSSGIDSSNKKQFDGDATQGSSNISSLDKWQGNGHTTSGASNTNSVCNSSATQSLNRNTHGYGSSNLGNGNNKTEESLDHETYGSPNVEANNKKQPSTRDTYESSNLETSSNKKDGTRPTSRDVYEPQNIAASSKRNATHFQDAHESPTKDNRMDVGRSSLSSNASNTDVDSPGLWRDTCKRMTSGHYISQNNSSSYSSSGTSVGGMMDNESRRN